MNFKRRYWWSGRSRVRDRPVDDALIAICEAEPPKSYLEIGTREGGSLTAVLRHSKPQPKFVTCCDTWGNTLGGTGRGNHQHIDAVMDEEGYEGDRQWLDGKSQQLIPEVAATFELVLVDGDHRPVGQRFDVFNAWRIVKPGGLMVVDDTATEHVWRCVEDLLIEADAKLVWRGHYRQGCAVVRRAG